jgi:hypothetical protein
MAKHLYTPVASAIKSHEYIHIQLLILQTSIKLISLPLEITLLQKILSLMESVNFL